MSEAEWNSEVRQEEWSLEMIFRWLEESPAFLYEIEAHRRRAQKSDPLQTAQPRERRSVPDRI
jgi:hypothetical protein